MRAVFLKNQSPAPQVLCSCTTSFTTSKPQIRFRRTLSHHRLHPSAPSYRQTRALSSDFKLWSSKFQKPLHVQKVAKMSWMDSWSRPSKSQATPAPYYLLPGGESTPYCKTCGRVIGKFCALLFCLKTVSTKTDISEVLAKRMQVKTRHLLNTAQVDARAVSQVL
jgi:hypothetical protein